VTTIHGRAGLALALLITGALALTACSSSAYSGGSAANAPQSQSVSCDEVMQSVLQRERVGDTAGAINGEMQFLMDNCPSQYDAVTGFIAAKIGIASSGFEPCDVWPSRVGEEATALLRAEGLCEGGGNSANAGGSEQSGQPGGGIAWSEAGAHVGSTQRVCGPLRSQRPWENNVFLNIGLDYPDPGRFTIVLWEVGEVETLNPGVTLCVEGRITSYEGVSQIELYDPSRVEIWE